MWAGMNRDNGPGLRRARRIAARFAVAAPGLLLGLVACGLDPIPERAAEGQAPPPAAPLSGSLNAAVLSILREYPTDGSYAYWWPREGSWRGTTRDLFWAGARVAEGDPERRSYCSGITWEVWIRAVQSREGGEAAVRAAIPDAVAMEAFRRLWFGAGGNRDTLARALVEYGLGTPLASWDDAQPGDLLQLWRGSGSGHSAIFLGWERDARGAILGLRYWSSQRPGVGEKTEFFEPPGGVARGELYLVRPLLGAGVAPAARSSGAACS